MTATWQIRLKNMAGALVAIIDDYESLSLLRRVNGMGAYALRMNGNDEKCGLFELDGQIEFWRRDAANGIDWYKEFEAFHRTPAWHFSPEDKLVFESTGPGYAELLARRVVQDKTGTAEATKAGVAETIVKAFVNEQCGPGAGARAQAGLAIQADAATGNVIRLARPFRYVLEVAQEAADIGGGDFAVVGTGAATFEFRWYDGQLGTDRSSTVIFALERGNMAEPELCVDRLNEVTAVLVGGQGSESDRETLWRTDAARIAESTWNRREQFINDSNEPVIAGLQDKGDVALEAGRPKNPLTFKPLQTPACLYGLHYFLGDLVMARFLTVETKKKMVEVRFTIDANGERCDIGAEDAQ